MGFLKILKKIHSREKEMRILMLGLDNAGKTSIAQVLKKQNIDNVLPTLGFSIETILWNKYTVHIWDVGGQKTLQTYWRNYFEKTDGLIWVIDSTDIERMELCRDQLHTLLSQEKLSSCSLLIFANKQDIDGALNIEEIISILQLDILALQKKQWTIQPCSAQTKVGIDFGMDFIVTSIATRLYPDNGIYNTTTRSYIEGDVVI